MKRIDSHQHFWQLSHGDYAWLSPDLEALYQDYLPIDLQPILKNENVDKTVLIQAADTTAETEFLLQLAQDNDFIGGVVGWVDMESADVFKQLELFCQNPYFKGIRPMIQDIADINWMLMPEFSSVYEYLIDKQLTFDALIKPQHLKTLHTLLLRYPQLSVVIDHGAKPDIAKELTPDWFNEITLIAEQTSAYCKLSGLVTEAGSDPEFEKLNPYMSHLLSSFGAERLMWGSDWPVIKLASDYASWIRQVEEFLIDLPKAQQQLIWATNAQRFYHIE